MGRISRSEEGGVDIHGDMLEAILSHVPLIHLLPASHVSKSWNRAVSSSLSHLNPIKPWLLVYTQSPRAPHVITTHAYDPRSRAWLQIRDSTFKPFSAVRSSHSTLLYMLSPTAFAFSFDPLHLTWNHAPASRVWRTDPVVALVGHKVVVAGGACDFEDDPLAVEMFDLRTQAWVACKSMPEMLKGSSSSTWLSVAVVGERILVTEKTSGATYGFNPSTDEWEGPYDVRSEESVYSVATGSVKGRFVVAGAVGEGEEMKGVKLWEVRGELGKGREYWMEEIGEMPKEMVEKMKGEEGYSAAPSITMTTVGDYVYIQNTSEPEWMMVWETGTHKWECIHNVVLSDETRLRRMVVACADVDMDHLQRAVRENRSFGLK